MDLFTYLMAKNGNNSSVHGDLFSYLLGKAQGGGGQIKTASGITIYIPDATRTGIVSFMMTKESTQDGTPTPDNPVEVNVVEGYRNLFDFVNGNYVSGNGATINRIDGEYTIINVSSEYGGARFFQSDLQLKPKTNYTFSAMIKDTNSEIGSYVFIPKAMNLYNREILGNIITSNGISIVKFTTPEEIPSTAFIGLYPRGLNVTATFTNIMIIEGDQALPYVPYGNNYVNVNITGENIFDNTITPLVRNEYTNYSVLNDNITISSNVSANSGILWNIPVTQGKNITISYDSMNETTSNVNNYVFYYFSNNPVTTFDYGQNSIDKNKKSVTITATDNYLILGLRGGNNTGYTLSGLKVGYTSIVPLPLNGNIIAGIGDYKDELKVDKSGHVFINKKTGKVVLDGTENWEGRPNYTYADRFLFGITTIPLQSVKCFSNYFKVENVVVTDFPVLILNNGQQLIINFSEKGTTTLSQFKAWLSTHNTEIYYASRKPQLIDLNYTVDLKLFKGVNNVSNSEDGYMTIQYR